MLSLVCPPVQEIIHSLRLVDYRLLQADKPWYKHSILFIFQAENTFILTLDGDVDFKPESVKLLIDRMKKNRKVGAVCGRIHPIGSGRLSVLVELQWLEHFWNHENM